MRVPKQRICFDTDILHVIAGALRGSGLPDHLRSSIVLSPISVIEMILKLPRDDGRNFFRSIKAMQNWLPVSRTVMDYPHEILAAALGVVVNSSVHVNVGYDLDAIFQASSFEEYMNSNRDRLTELKNMRDEKKTKSADLDARLVNEIREEKYKLQDFPVHFVRKVAERYGLQPTPARENAVLARFSAHFEFRTMRLSIAVNQPDYPFLKQVNDVWDSYQLIYLAYPNLQFVTGEKKFAKVRKSDQRARIHVARRSELQDGKKVRAFLEELV